MSINFEKYNTPDKLAKSLDVMMFACESARRHLPPQDNLCRSCAFHEICGLDFEEMVLYFESETD